MPIRPRRAAALPLLLCAACCCVAAEDRDGAFLLATIDTLLAGPEASRRPALLAERREVRERDVVKRPEHVRLLDVAAGRPGATRFEAALAARRASVQAGDEDGERLRMLQALGS